MSRREQEILNLAALGYTDKRIGALLGLRLGTISTYWARIRSKWGPSTRAELVARWVRAEMAEKVRREVAAGDGHEDRAEAEVRRARILSHALDAITRLWGWAAIAVVYGNGTVSFLAADEASSLGLRAPAGCRSWQELLERLDPRDRERLLTAVAPGAEPACYVFPIAGPAGECVRTRFFCSGYDPEHDASVVVMAVLPADAALQASR